MSAYASMFEGRVCTAAPDFLNALSQTMHATNDCNTALEPESKYTDSKHIKMLTTDDLSCFFWFVYMSPKLNK